MTSRTAACQALPSMEFPRQEYWSRLPFPSPGDLPDPGIEPGSPALAGGFFTTGPPGKPPGYMYRLLHPPTTLGGGCRSSTHLTDGHTEAQGGAGPRVWALMASVPMMGEVWVGSGVRTVPHLRRTKGQHFCVPLPECGVVAFTHRVVVGRGAELQALRQQS